MNDAIQRTEESTIVGSRGTSLELEVLKGSLDAEL